MLNPKKILVAYDGSPHSKAALGWALLLGSTVHAELLEVIKVFEPVNPAFTKLYYNFNEKVAEWYAANEKEDRRMLEEVKAFCERHGKMKVHVDVLKGPVASILLEHAGRNGVDLIVAGTKGQGLLDQILVGSLTHSLVSLSKVPVLVVKEQQAPHRLKKILVAYDGSEFAKTALNLAIEISRSSGSALSAAKVTDPQDFTKIYGMAESGSALKLGEKLAELGKAEMKLLEEVKLVAAHKGAEIGTELLPAGHIADTLIQYAGKIEADMIVAGTLGHGLLGELLVGSVTRNLISMSKIPVLVVKK